MSELVPANPSATTGVVVYNEPDSLSDLVRLKPSNLDLFQYTSRKQGGVPGKFFDGDKNYDKITIVPLDIRRARALFPPGNDFTQKPLCRSNDGVVPSPFAQFPQSRDCKSCPKSQWRKGPGGKNIRPECGESFNLLAIDKESTLPVWVRFKGKGIAPFKNFMERIEKHRISHYAKNGVKPSLYDYVFSISGQEVVDNTGRYFVPLFTDLGRVETLSTFGPFYEQYVVNASRNLQTEDEGVDEAIAQIAAPAAGGSVLDAEYVEA